MELTALIEEIIDRNIRVAEIADLAFVDSNFVNGVERLHLSLA